MALVLIVLIFFLVSMRAAVIVALTIPLGLLFAFILLHLRGVPANLFSINRLSRAPLTRYAGYLRTNRPPSPGWGTVSKLQL